MSLYVSFTGALSGGRLAIAVVVVPGGLLGFPLLFLAGYAGTRVGRACGYAGWMKARFDEYDRVNEPLVALLSRSLDSWRSETLRLVWDGYPGLAAKHASVDDLVAYWKSTNGELLRAIMRNAEFHNDESVVSWGREFLVTNYRLFLLHASFWGSTVETMVALDDIRDYRFVESDAKMVISLKSGAVIEKHARYAPLERIVRYFMERRQCS